MMRHILLALAVLAGAAAFAAEQPPRYAVRFFGHGTSAFALNELGDTVGWTTSGGATRAWVAPKNRPLELLPLAPGYVSSAAYDINDSGLIVGNLSPATHSSLQTVACLWRRVNGQYEVQVLSGLPGQPYSAAMAVNNLGDVVGGSGYTGYGYQWRNAVLFTPNGTVPLLDWLSCADINDQRVVVAGRLQLDLDTMQVVDVGLPPGNWQGVVTGAVNDRNDMAGWISNYGSSLNVFPVRYLAGTGWQTLGGGANYTSATAINNRRDTLTFYEYTACQVHFEGIGSFAPGALIDPSQGLWYVLWSGASDINDAREMLVGVKDATLTQTGAALLTPILPRRDPSQARGNRVID